MVAAYDDADKRYGVVERMNSATAGNERSGLGLDAAIMALRRGDPVLLDSRDNAILALAAEFVTDDNIARLRVVSRRPAGDRGRCRD